MSGLRRTRLDAVAPRASFAVPAVVAAAVVSLSVTLLLIGARSPYTHANLFPAYNSAYTRTEQVVVGPGEDYAGVGGEVGTGDAAGRGARLFVTKSCATCHGLEARGGTFAPPIVGADAETIAKRARKGPGGMPRYGQDGLSDQQIADIAAFLSTLVTKK